MKKSIGQIGFCLILIYFIGSIAVDAACAATAHIAAGGDHTLTLFLFVHQSIRSVQHLIKGTGAFGIVGRYAYT